MPSASRRPAASSTRRATVSAPARPGLGAQWRGLAARLEGDLRTDALTRGLYATDASIYQINPEAVVLPRSAADVAATLDHARAEGVPVTARGAGTSQGGQAIGRGLVVDTSRWFNRILRMDPETRRATVQPGVVLDDLNRVLAPHGLWFPVDVATSSRATLGGMAGNNSAGGRSIRYGMMADNVHSVTALLADGSTHHFASRGGTSTLDEGRTQRLRQIRVREAEELRRRVPAVLRHVAGYALHRIGEDGAALADLLVGSEGTLAFFTELEVALAPLPAHRVLGVCHFPSLRAALAAVPAIVELEPTAVELTDGALIALARARPEFRPRVEGFVRGTPGALLFVEFAGPDPAALRACLDALEERTQVRPGPVVRAESPQMQAEVWAVRKAGMNIVMSGPEAAKPVSIIEDCAIPLDRLTEWGDRLGAVFAEHGVQGTWYAHASVGCLHVRPSLNLRDGRDVTKLRSIAEAAHEIVRDLGGSHSGEHGDGRIRSEFIESMLGPSLTRAFAEVKAVFDPTAMLNPGIIVDPQPVDERSTFRYGPDYRALPVVEHLAWERGMLGAVERCNNNGACRKRAPGVMCPSFRATEEEVDTPRGRANTLRLALTGQLRSEPAHHDDPLTDPAVHAALDLCLGCKACARECPTGVDVTRLKTEALAHRNEALGTSARTRAFAGLPRLAPRVAGLAGLINRLSGSRLLRQAGARMLGIAAERTLPAWSSDPFRDMELEPARPGGLMLFSDTFNRWFEPETLRAATRVLFHLGQPPGRAPGQERRPLCCGRTYLSAGLVAEARTELERTASVLVPHIQAGGQVVGLEPSCVFTFRDEAAALLPPETAEVLAQGVKTFEEVVDGLAQSKGLTRRDDSGPAEHAGNAERVAVHGHCHQKAFGTAGLSVGVLRELGGTDVAATAIESTCCGMAGSFGYEREHVDVSRAVAGLDLLPALDRLDTGARVVADGFSCRHQIRDLSGRTAVHTAVILDELLNDGRPTER